MPEAADVAPNAAAATTRAGHKDSATQAKKGAKKARVSKPAKAAKLKPAKPAKPAAEARDGSKKSVILGLLRRPAGATMAEIVTAVECQKHSIRGFLSETFTKKLGLTLESTKNEAGGRTYRIKQ